jgi:hypothetical protein
MFCQTYLQPSTLTDKEHPKIDFSGESIRGPEACTLVLMEASISECRSVGSMIGNQSYQI